MLKLTPEGEAVVAELARRHGVSVEAVGILLEALVRGNGSCAQFSHPELGGLGQWMRGGMTQVGDMFNNALRAKVDSLCTALSEFLAQQPVSAAAGVPSQAQWQFQGERQQGVAGSAAGPGSPGASLFVPPGSERAGQWWPPELGTPSSTGAQNNVRYAFFPVARRLAIEVHGAVTVYDTLEHEIRGVSQQQSVGASLTFTSQKGVVELSTLPVVSRSPGG